MLADAGSTPAASTICSYNLLILNDFNISRYMSVQTYSNFYLKTWAHNPLVGGSSPPGPTIFINELRNFTFFTLLNYLFI